MQKVDYDFLRINANIQWTDTLYGIYEFCKHQGWCDQYGRLTYKGLKECQKYESINSV